MNRIGVRGCQSGHEIIHAAMITVPFGVENSNVLIRTRPQSLSRD